MEAKLIVVGGDAKTTEIHLKLPTIIGRGRGATLTLPHPLVSRQHCEIYESDGRLYVRDLGSLNGTFIGNEPVMEAVLPPGELLTVGAVTFRAIYGELLEKDRREKPAAVPPKRVSAAEKTRRNETLQTFSPSLSKANEAPRGGPAVARPAPKPVTPAQDETVWTPDLGSALPPQNKTAPAPGARRAPSSPAEEAGLPADAGDQEAEYVPFRDYLEDHEDSIDIDVEDSGEIEVAELEEELFADVDDAAEHPSGDRVTDEALPEGSTADSEKAMPTEWRNALTECADSSVALDDVDVVDEGATRIPQDLPPVVPPAANPAPPRSASAPDEGAPRRPGSPGGGPGASAPSSNGAPEKTPDADEDELRAFLRKLK